MKFLLSESIRMVIWDLDETFWGGTLTEGGIVYNRNNHDIVIELCRRGIMNSICSKNDFLDVENVLREKNIWDYFVFNSINWLPKGERVKKIIEYVKLRPSSVLFIDDNPLNLAEVKACVPEINVASDEIIEHILTLEEFTGKDDEDLSRLQDYKLLEKKTKKQVELKADTKTFLRSSGIQVSFEYNLLPHLDRIVELINRTNQLNFTKKRLPENLEEARACLADMLSVYCHQAALVKVKDNFGDYGFVGFYLLKNNIANGSSLEHFCFSCRTLGMGVEKWVFDHLEKPSISVEGSVAVNIFDDVDVDWINTNNEWDCDNKIYKNDNLTIVARGGCEMLSISHYFHNWTSDVRNESSQVYDGIERRYEHSSLIPILKKKEDGINYGESILRDIGYQEEHLTSSLFKKDKGKQVIVLTLWSDIYYPAYRHKETGLDIHFSVYPAFPESAIDLISRGKTDLDPAFAGGWFESAVDKIISEFEFLGKIGLEATRRNIEPLLNTLDDQRIMILIGLNEQRSDISNPKTAVPELRDLNEFCLRMSKKYDRVFYIDIMPLIKKFGITDDPNHFPRELYYEVSEEIASILREKKFLQ